MQKKLDSILFISPAIPRPDMNSGDLRLFSILKILIREYKIVYMPIDIRPDDKNYIDLMRSHGITVYINVESFWKMMKKEVFKIAVLEFYYTAEHYIDRIRFTQPECKIVVDSVDVHFLRLKLKYNLTKEKLHYNTFIETKNREMAVYCKADEVLTVTAEDALVLQEECSDINGKVIPNIHEICLSGSASLEDQLIFVGGFSHEPNVDAVKYFCQDILPLIWKHKPDVKVVIVGSNPPADVLSFACERIIVTGYVPETTPYLHQSKVSIAPLRFGAGMKGKIGEAMAHGVPVVTTSIGGQGMDLTDHNNVMIADSAEKFAASVLELMINFTLYEKLRNNAIKYIETKYTSTVVDKIVTDIFRKICEKPVKKMNLGRKFSLINNYMMGLIKSF